MSKPKYQYTPKQHLALLRLAKVDSISIGNTRAKEAHVINTMVSLILDTYIASRAKREED